MTEQDEAGVGAGDVEEERQRIERPVAPSVGELSPMLTATSDRLKDVLQVTEDAAERILDDAKAEAEKYVEAARARTDSLSRERMDRIENLTGDLLDQASSIQGQMEKLRQSLSAATSQLDSELAIQEKELTASEPAAPAASPEVYDEPEYDEPESIPESSPSAEDDEGESAGLFGRRRKRKPAPADSSDGARILALQLSVAGADQETIETRLRELGVEDTDAVLESMDSHPTSS